MNRARDLAREEMSERSESGVDERGKARKDTQDGWKREELDDSIAKLQSIFYTELLHFMVIKQKQRGIKIQTRSRNKVKASWNGVW